MESICDPTSFVEVFAEGFLSKIDAMQVERIETPLPLKGI